MGNLIEEEDYTFFDEKITEYKVREKRMVGDFVSGIIDLGEILLSCRSNFKKSGTWLKYCDALGLSVSKANDQIRFFEASQSKLLETKKDLIGQIITNWKKMQLYLGLPEELKEKIITKAEEGEITDSTTSQEFTDIIGEIKGTPELEVGDIFENLDINNDTLVQNPKLVARALQAKMGLGNSSLVWLEGVLNINNGILQIEKALDSGITNNDAKFIIDALKEPLNKLFGRIYKDIL